MAFSEALDTYFVNNNISITLFPSQEKYNITSINNFYSLIQMESNAWKECNRGKIREINRHFKQILNILDNDINSINNQPNAIRDAVAKASINKFPCVFSSTIHGKRLIEIYNDPINLATSSNSISDGYCYYLNNEALPVMSRSLLIGFLEAYSVDYPAMAKDYEQSISGIVTNLVKGYHDDFDSLHRTHIDNNQKLEKSTESHISKIENWRAAQEKGLNEFVEQRKLQINVLEETYQTKLMLEKPAQYWDELHNEYKKKGIFWMVATLISSLIFIGCFLMILYEMPACLNGNFLDINYGTIKSALLLAVVVSISIFLVRFFVKMTLSAFHLSRDSRERKQLTYFYLSLISNKSVDEKDRAIILQSLFSRADTGLLKGDSSPAFPDGMLQQIAKLLGK